MREIWIVRAFSEGLTSLLAQQRSERLLAIDHVICNGLPPQQFLAMHPFIFVRLAIQRKGFVASSVSGATCKCDLLRVGLESPRACFLSCSGERKPRGANPNLFDSSCPYLLKTLPKPY
eukprot:326498-Rhodomonas_salina.2